MKHLMAHLMILAAAVAALGSGPAPAPAPAPHGAPKADAKAPETPAAAEQIGPTTRYVHKWIPLPPLAGARLPAADGLATVAPVPGRMTIVVFLASWCEPCQELVPELRKVEARYKRLAADFHYVFAHDTLDDATGFMKEFAIDGGLLANHEILKTFHNPDLPTIYVGDRHGWMMTRYVKAGNAAVADLEESLKLLTAN